MHQRGILSSLIIVGFLAVQGLLLQSSSRIEQEMQHAIETAIEIEKLNSIRTNIENSVDYIIAETARGGAKKHLHGEEIKGIINERLLALFREFENAYSNGIKVRFYSRSGEMLTADFLNRNSSVLVVNINSKIIVEYSFTGGVLKNERLYAVLASPNAEDYFRLPAGYLQRIVV